MSLTLRDLSLTPLSLCVFLFTAPVSIKDQIKIINEKFAGTTAQWQAEETYPSQCSLANPSVRVCACWLACLCLCVCVECWLACLCLCVCRVLVLLDSSPLQVVVVVRRSSTWEISLGCPTATQSVTLQRTSQPATTRQPHLSSSLEPDPARTPELDPARTIEPSAPYLHVTLVLRI